MILFSKFPMKFYNTLTRKKEEFIPLEDKKIKMYVCGPTVYGPAHIGHARTYVVFDFIRKYFEYRGYKVKFVVNITDVHDDIIKRANELNTTIFELAEKNIKEFLEDMDKLGIKRADVYPRVTEHIKEIIEVIQILIDKGYAYETSDGVYFDVSKFKDYGKLSGIKFEKGISGKRVDVDKYEKEAACDFALWKKAKQNEPFWPSPFGKGRPGWHIECSVMSTKYLGKQFDIHGGAKDLIFPHHENEIAQSEAAFGIKPFVRYWIHSGLLKINGEKMSKSLGNIILVPELLEKCKPKLFRFFVLMAHYSSELNFSWEILEKTKKTWKRINEFIQRLMEIQKEGEENTDIKNLIAKFKEEIIALLDDDFQTPAMFAKLFDFEREINKMFDNLNKKDAQNILSFIKELDSFLGVFEFKERKVELTEEQKKLIKEREKLRKEKKFKEADEIREKLRKQGIELIDTPEGTKWRKIN